MTDTNVENPNSPPPPPPPPAAWHTGIEGEELGHLQNRGWDKLSAADAARAAAKAHREAEKHIGIPADKIARLPKDASDAEGYAALYAKLGVPADEKGYDFSTVKHADGKAPDEGFTTEMAKVLRASGVAKDKAADILKVVVARDDARSAAALADKTAALNAQRDALKIDWGSNVEANLIIARNAAKTLGVDPEAVAALEGQVGYAAVMKMFQNIGVRMGEAAFVGGGAGGTNTVLTVDQAKADLATKMADAAWGAKLSNGDATAMKEFDNLTRIITRGG